MKKLIRRDIASLTQSPQRDWGQKKLEKPMGLSQQPDKNPMRETIRRLEFNIQMATSPNKSR